MSYPVAILPSSRCLRITSVVLREIRQLVEKLGADPDSATFCALAFESYIAALTVTGRHAATYAF